eukprot:Nitzschia sp. Nitz4//scaffold11_size288233//225650//226696//NITZ4_000805-RA/size288233-processed-gene-0.183-mRNA-1//1//CDS//3329534167//7796//frame0
MAFPCKPCQTCGKHASPYFDPVQSTTLQWSRCGSCRLEGVAICALFGNQCEINQKYTEGSSWKAYEVEDIVWLGTSNVLESVEDYMRLAVPYAFGCQTSIQGLFQKQFADGILGLARHKTSIVTAYFDAGVIPRNAFSLCLTLTAGRLSLGGPMPSEYHKEPMRMAPISRDHGWYSLHVTKVLVGDIVVTAEDVHVNILDNINDGKGCILDSGTTDTYLPKSLARKISKAAIAWSDGLVDFSDRTRNRRYTFEDFQKLPDVTFKMSQNVTMTMYPKNYMEGVPLDPNGDIEAWQGFKSFANRIYLSEKNGAVLGANAMVGYDILFDIQGHQIGIAPADCSATPPSTIF